MPCDCEQSTLELKPAIICIQKSSTESKIVTVPWCPSLPFGVTINSSAWAVLAGDCVISDDTLSGFVTSTTVSSGEPGQLCILHNTIETDTGLTLVQVIECYVSNEYVPVLPAC